MDPANEYHSEFVAERALPKFNLHVWEQNVPLPKLPQTHPFLIQLQLRAHLGAMETELYQQEHKITQFDACASCAYPIVLVPLAADVIKDVIINSTNTQ